MHFWESAPHTVSLTDLKFDTQFDVLYKKANWTMKLNLTRFLVARY